MVMDPSTGQGFDAVEVGTDDYFDPNATSDAYPGVVGLQMRSHHFWQGDVAFDTYEELGPTDQSIITSGSDPSNPTDAGRQTGNSAAGFVVLPGPPTFVPEFGETYRPIVVELHGVYGFPSAEGVDVDPILSYNTVCRLPITPEKLPVNFPSNNHYSPVLIGGGEIMIPGTETLESITFDSFWPSDYDDSYMVISQNDFLLQGTPQQAIANLIWTKRWGLVCRLVIGDPGIFTDYVVITDFSYSHVYGTTDYDFSIGLKRWKSTTITSVPNPDADIDHFSVIPRTTTGTTFPGGNIPVPDDKPPTFPDTGNGSLPAPGTVDPGTVFPDVPSAANAQMQGQVQNPIVQVQVLPITDSRTKGGGSMAFWDTGKGETLNDLAWRMGVTWEGVQKDINNTRVWDGDAREEINLSTVDPNRHLPIGTNVKIALSTPTLQATPKTSGDNVRNYQNTLPGILAPVHLP